MKDHKNTVPEQGHEDKKRPHIQKGSIKRLVQYIWCNNKIGLIAVAIGIVMSALATVIATVILQQIIDALRILHSLTLLTLCFDNYCQFRRTRIFTQSQSYQFQYLSPSGFCL